MNPAVLIDIHSRKPDAALDMVYQTIDNLAHWGCFAEVDLILADHRLLTLPTDLLLAFLTVTLPFRSRLTTRESLVVAARQVLTERGEDAGALLAGL